MNIFKSTNTDLWSRCSCWQWWSAWGPTGRGWWGGRGWRTADCWGWAEASRETSRRCWHWGSQQSLAPSRDQILWRVDPDQTEKVIFLYRPIREQSTIGSTNQKRVYSPEHSDWSEEAGPPQIDNCQMSPGQVSDSGSSPAVLQCWSHRGHILKSGGHSCGSRLQTTPAPSGSMSRSPGWCWWMQTLSTSLYHPDQSEISIILCNQSEATHLTNHHQIQSPVLIQIKPSPGHC